MRSPTARTLAYLKAQNIPAQVVEKWIPVRGHPGGGVRKDLFDAIDVIALDGGIIGIQSTSGSNHAAREKKAAASPNIAHWMRVGGHFEVWSWAKKATKKKDGSKGVKRWMPRMSGAALVHGAVVFNGTDGS